MTPDSCASVSNLRDPHACTSDEALIDRARSLAAACRVTGPGLPLRGKMLCVLCDDANGEAAVLFVSAATELGAHVSCVRINLCDRSPPEVVHDTAALLARLYEAVECLDLSPALVQRLRDAAGIPFFMGAATPAHRTAALASRVAGDGTSPADARRRVLQALLIDTLA